MNILRLCLFCSLLEHVLIVLGVDWRVSGLRGRLLLHGGQPFLHWSESSLPIHEFYQVASLVYTKERLRRFRLFVSVE